MNLFFEILSDHFVLLAQQLAIFVCIWILFVSLRLNKLDPWLSYLDSVVNLNL